MTTWVEIPMHAWHPVAVHLPLVALTGAVLFDLADGLAGGGRWRTAATVLWMAGLLGGLVAVATGLWAYGRVDHSDASHALMTRHRNLAFVALGVLALSGLGRAVRRSRAPAVLGLAGLGLLGWVGYLGGELVYRHATGLTSARLHQVLEERGFMPMNHDSLNVRPDSLPAARAPHRHDDSSTHRH